MSDYSSNFPTQRPKLNLVFNSGSDKLDSRLSYSRSSGGTYMSSEKSLNSENLISQSADLGSWSEGSTSYTTITSNATTAPDGTTTAAQITGLTGTNKKAIYHGITTAPTGNHTGVAYVKPNGHEYVQLMFGGAPSVYQNYHLSGSGTKGNGGNDDATIEKLGDWYKLTISSTALAGWATNIYVVMVDSNTAARYEDSTSTSSIYAWGANFSSTNQKVFNSTSGQIHREFAPTLKTAAADEPRFEFDASGNSEGLLIEAQAVNLQRYGSDFASWSDKSNSTVTANSGIAPNGLLEADLAIATSASNYHYIFDIGATVATATQYTGSCYVKQAGHRYIQLTGGSATFGSVQYATFDLDDGSVDVNGGVTASAVGVGNGWYRITATMTSTGTGTGGIAIAFANSATSSRLPTFTGNDYDGVLCWGFQFETGSAASSLANSGTSSSGVTRASDSCSVALSDVGITSGQDLTAIVEGEAAEIAGAALIGFDDGTSSNYARITRHANNNYTFDVRTNASSQALITLGSSSSDTNFAFRVENNNIGASAGGSAVTTDTSATIGLMTTMQIGNAYWGTAANGTLSRVSIYSEPLSDTNLTALTSS